MKMYQKSTKIRSLRWTRGQTCHLLKGHSKTNAPTGIVQGTNRIILCLEGAKIKPLGQAELFWTRVWAELQRFYLPVSLKGK